MRAPALLFLLTVSPVLAQAQSRDFVVKPGTGQTETLDPNDLIRAHNDLAEFEVELQVVGNRTTIAEGETVQFSVRSDRDGFVTLLAQNTEGRVVFLSPNPYSPSARVSANRPTRIPADGSFTIEASPPFGLEYVKAIVTPEPLVDWDRVPDARTLAVVGPASADDAERSDGGSTLGGFDPSLWASDEITVRTVPTGAVSGPSIPQPTAPAPRYSSSPDDQWDSLFAELVDSGGNRSFSAPASSQPEQDDPEDILVIYRPRTGTRSFGESIGSGHLFNNVRLVPADASQQNVGGTRSFGDYGQTLDEQVAALNQDPDVLVAVPDFKVSHFGMRPPLPTQTAPATPPFVGAYEANYWGLQWALHNGFYRSESDRIDLGWLDGLRQYRSSGDPVVVAVLDTGGLLDHPALQPFLWTNAREIPGNGIDDDGNNSIDDVHGYDFVDDDGDPTDPNEQYSHGTFVATQIPYDPNARDLFGLAPDVQLMIVRVIGQEDGRINTALRGIDYAVRNGAQVINLSLGFQLDAPHRELETAIREVFVRANAEDVLLVTAAGNLASDSRTSYTYPARVGGPNTISVGALAITGERAEFSNYGPAVEVLAPGERILGYGSAHGRPEPHMGTSMSAPFVSAAAAMLISQNPSWSPAEIKARLLERVTELPDVDVASGGTIHIGRALGD